MKHLTILAAVLALCAGPVTAQPTWRLDKAPTLTLEGFRDDLFARVVGAATLTDGSIAVADDRSFAVRFFDQTGQPLASVGREGGGPGEFRLMTWLGTCGGDTVSIYDPAQARIVHIHGRTREVATEINVPTNTYELACGPNRRLVATTKPAGWGQGVAVGPYRTTSEVRLLAPDITLGTFASAERYRWQSLSDASRQTDGPRPYGRRVVVGVTSERVYVGTADSFYLAAYDFNGRRAGAITRDVPTRRFERADRDRYIDDQVAAALRFGANMTRERFDRQLGKDGLPETVPSYDRALADGARLWVREGVTPRDVTRQWWGFDGQGRVVGRIVVPRAFDPYEIRNETMLGRWTDEDGVGSVRRYRLVLSQ